MILLIFKIPRNSAKKSHLFIVLETFYKTDYHSLYIRYIFLQKVSYYKLLNILNRNQGNTF